MDLKATEASIDITFSYAGDDLKEILRLSEIKKKAIEGYLKKQGYSKKDIDVKNINVSDKQKYYVIEWQNGQEVEVKVDRYTVTQTLILASNDVISTENKSSKINLDLVSRDLTATLTTNYYFTELNTIKPKLIAASTKNARIAGEQFANDSQAKLGKIKTPSQGQITIAGDYYCGDETSSKPEEPYLQKCRVVSTIVFFLE